MIYEPITRYSFEEAFRKMNRDYYSSDGYNFLYEMLDELDDNVELDVIAICCNYTEYENDEALLSEHGDLIDADDFDDEDEKMETLVSEIEKRTMIARLDNGGYLLQIF